MVLLSSKLGRMIEINTTGAKNMMPMSSILKKKGRHFGFVCEKTFFNKNPLKGYVHETFGACMTIGTIVSMFSLSAPL